MAMSIQRLKEVRALAEKVADLTELVERDIIREKRRYHGTGSNTDRFISEGATLLSGTSNSGELRRRSMDLTRALAKLRGREV